MAPLPRSTVQRRAGPSSRVRKPVSRSTSPIAGLSPAAGGLSSAEIAFADGWQALRARRFAEAASAFGSASEAAKDQPLAQDAWFWRAVCQARIPRRVEARSSLAASTRRFPLSPRHREASAMLGWILLQDGDVEGAAQRFGAAEHDRVDEVRRSARAGLELVKRHRGEGARMVPAAPILHSSSS